MKNSSTVDSRVSSLARELRPYWQRDLDRIALRGNGGGNGNGGGGVMAVHDLSGGFHTGILANSQGPQFALLDGSRTFTGDITLTAGTTIDGVDLSTHAADPNAHHFRATGGDGILVSGDSQVVSVRTSGAGSGLSFNGDGDLYLDVKEGVEIDGNALRVDAGYAFHWTALHTHSGNIEFSGDRTISSTAGSDVTIDLGADADLLLADDQTFRSVTYLDAIPISGFSLHQTPAGTRQLTIQSIKADEMHVRAFVADTVRVDVGEEWWGKSMGLLYEAFTTPAGIGGTATMILEDSPALDGALFTSGDWVMLRQIDLPPPGDPGEGNVYTIWGQVSAYVNLDSDENGIGRQQWTFTLRSGPFSATVNKGAVVVDFGVMGQGYIHLSTLDSAQGPWLRIGDWTGATPFEAGSMQPRTQIGRLDGIGDADLDPTGWGLYSDNAYLRGLLRTPNALLDFDALSIFVPKGFTERQHGYAITFEDDTDHYLYGGLYGYHAYGTSAAQKYRVIQVRAEDHPSWPAQTHVQIQSWSLAGNDGRIELSASTGGDHPTSGLDLYAGLFMGESRARLYSDHIVLDTDDSGDRQVTVAGHVTPESDLDFDLGTASLRWRNLYVDQLFVSGSISGDTLSGAEWEFPGSMIIDPHSAGATTVSITNQGTGTASLSVEGNITLGGTVDGVDIAGFHGDFSGHESDPVHHDPATAGSGITVTGQLIAVNSTVVRTTRQVIAGDGLDGGGALSSDVTLTVDSSVVRTSRVLTAGAGLSGGGALSADRSFAVNAGDGIAIVGDAVTVRLRDPSGLAIDGGELRILDAFAGNGLTMVDKVMSVVPGDGIRLLSDAVAVELAFHSGLQFASGALQLGAPGDVAKGVTAAVSSATHRHTVVSTADANSTPDTLLHATTAGGLTLGTLSVAGNVDITDGGDLDVANHTLFVDASKNSVGIGGIPLDNPDFPDSQFALDINGPARAQYWIGPHAIQLKDVLLLSHFDGKEPYNTNETGEPNSMMGQVAVSSTASSVSNLVFRPGKFFKAVEIARASTNLVTNPQFDGGSTTGWLDYVSGAAAGTRTTAASRETYIGEYAYRLLKNGGAAADKWGSYTLVPVTSGLTYTFSVWVYTEAMVGGSRRIRLQAENNVPTTSVTYDTPVEGTSAGWLRLNLTVTATTTGNARLIVTHDDVTSGLIYVSAVQATQTTCADPYTATTRSATWLYYANVAINTWARLTLMAWIYPAASASERGVTLRVLNLYKDASNFYRLDLSTANKLRLTTASGALLDSTGTVEGNAWTHVAITFGGGVATLYINGVADGSVSVATTPSGTLPTLYVGTTETQTTPLNGLVDEVVVVDRTVPAGELLSVYESNAPVFAESVRYSARFTQKGRGWFDDEGLWMKDALGNAVMGFYGGEAASKSWAGTTLSPGDIFLGRYGVAQGGWLRFDRDGAAGNPLLTLGYNEASVFELSATAAKLQGANLEIYSGTNEFLGVFATAPAGGNWGGVASDIAAGDVMIGDYDRGAALLWDDSALAVYIGGKPAHLGGTGNLFAASQTNAGFQRAGVWRLRMHNDGRLLINNSDGNPVFTFDSSAGAVFNRPLTLAAYSGGVGGGLYVGNGSFTNGSEGTGFKIWSPSANTGKIAGFKANVEQVSIDTDGVLKAGGGSTYLDADGLTILSGASPPNKIQWKQGSAVTGEVYVDNYSGTSVLGMTILGRGLLAADNGIVNIETRSGNEVVVEKTSFVGTTLTVGHHLHARGTRGLAVSGGYVHVAKQVATFLGDPATAMVKFDQDNSLLAKATLELVQSDVSEEFINYRGTSGAGTTTPVSTQALGAYAGKVRVAINDTFFWMPYYA